MEKTVPTTVKPLQTIRPSSGWAALNLREIWQFRDLLLTLAGRDVKLRYRQTALGVVWVVLQPLIAAGIFSFVFGKVAGLKSPGVVPYFVFSYAGLLGWQAFSSTLTKASSCLVGNSQLVSKVFFPRLVLPISTVFSTLIDFGVALVMMFALMAFNHVVPTLAILTLPIWMVLILIMAMGIGMLAAAMMVSYRDVQYVLPVVTSFLQYASPVAYSVVMVMQKLPAQYHPFYMLNPLSSLLEGLRWSLLGSSAPAPDWNWAVYAALCAIGVFVWGAFGFKKMERKFADVI
ncbi:MAG: ABC-type polysaccharide/polyol phosphate export system, permease component [Chthonomonadaceae bacterium]|nr:ABC-type polysaccharide/polyol phosphate export system, permease component [Chthonomonadaceae bacterium]